MEIDDHIKASIEKFSKKYPEIDPEKGRIVLTKIMKDRMSPKDAMGFSTHFLDTIYATAYNLFKSGKYEESTKIFWALTFFDPRNAIFSMALAASLHKQKEYQEAIRWYVATSILDQKTPLPYYHASDCFLKQDNIPGTLIMLKMMLKRVINEPKYQPLKEKAELMIPPLEKKLKKS